MKDKKNLIIMILSIVVVILLILLAFMFGLNAGKNNAANSDAVTTNTPEPDTSESTQAPTEQLTPEPTEYPQETEIPTITETPMPTPTPEPVATEIPEAPITEAPKDAFTLDINTDETWGESPKYYRMNMVLTNNTDTATNGWTLRIKVGENAAIDSGWRGKYSLNADTLVVTNEDHNAKIQAGDSIDFGLIISDITGDLSYTVEAK
ncbi:MAG: cellulose binding domain-containing protein [Lachnospiraceae bacterium]|nr:cellulose binding domain-containing protein [Lachnospiraceae bacterium]